MRGEVERGNKLPEKYLHAPEPDKSKDKRLPPASKELQSVAAEHEQFARESEGVGGFPLHKLLLQSLSRPVKLLQPSLQTL